MKNKKNSKKIIMILIAILIATVVIITILYHKKNRINGEQNISSLNTTNNEQSNNHENGGTQMNPNEERKINIKINNRTYIATLENNQTANEFFDLLPMTVTMTDHLSNEKFYDLSNELTTNASNPGRINSGDIMLFGSNTLVLFYDTFQTSYSYTRLGKIHDMSELKPVLGNANIEVTFEKAN